MTNWSKVRLGDINITTIIGDGLHGTPRYSEKGEYAFINGNNLIAGHIVIKSDTKIVDETEYQKYKKYLNNRTLFVSINGTLGNIAEYNNEKIILGKSVCYLNISPTVEKQFIKYVLLSSDFQKYLENNATGTTIKNISLKQIRGYSFSLPPLDVQKKIAGVLGALDDKIELNNKINQNLELQAQSLFNEIYNSSENGILSDIIDVLESGNRPKGGACTSGIPSIGAENIEKFGVYDFSKEKFISEEFFDNMKRGKVQSGDVLLYKDGAYTGKVSMALDGFPHKKCALNEHVFLLRANDKCSQFFLYYCLSCNKNKTYLHNLACAKAAQPGLNQQELLGMPVFIPGYDKIEKFTDTVNPLMHKIAQNALENIKLSTIRDALLPKLMNGEIDVENIPVSDIIPKE